MNEFYIGQIFEGIYPPEAALWCNENGALIEKTTNGYEIKTPPQLTQEELLESYEFVIQAHIVETAQSKGYDDDKSLLSYLNSNVEKWRTEATTFNDWRDSVWTCCHTILREVVNGERTAPTIEELTNELPTIQWNQ